MCFLFDCDVGVRVLHSVPWRGSAGVGGEEPPRESAKSFIVTESSSTKRCVKAKNDLHRMKQIGNGILSSYAAWGSDWFECI